MGKLTYPERRGWGSGGEIPRATYTINGVPRGGAQEPGNLPPLLILQKSKNDKTRRTNIQSTIFTPNSILAFVTNTLKSKGLQKLCANWLLIRFPRVTKKNLTDVLCKTPKWGVETNHFPGGRNTDSLSYGPLMEGNLNKLNFKS